MHTRDEVTNGKDVERKRRGRVEGEQFCVRYVKSTGHCLAVLRLDGLWTSWKVTSSLSSSFTTPSELSGF